MAMANSSLLWHQPVLAERRLQRLSACGNPCRCIDAFLQSRKLSGSFDGGSIKAAPRHLHCKAQAQDGRGTGRNASRTGLDQSDVQFVAGVSTSGTASETAAVGTVSPIPPSPSPSYIGSPLLWIGVGVGISALFSWAANNLKRYAMQQMFKTMMGQATPESSQLGGMPMTPGSVFPFPPLTTPPQASSPSTEAVDVVATQVTAQSSEAKAVAEEKVEPTKPAFVDISPQEVLEQKANGERPQESSDKNATKRVYFKDSDVSQDGSFTQPDRGATNGSSQSTGKTGSILSVEALEKMMEDPTVQKMVYPYLPKEMQNPTTFKWMLQNPQYRQQLEEMLKNMGGDEAWDNRMMDSLKNFDLSSEEVKQQFEQIGLTPEEVVAKIMANPDVAMAFQSPKVQAAIMDCSQNPLSITKYQNDKEVMDVFNKISELFPGMTGSP